VGLSIVLYRDWNDFAQIIRQGRQTMSKYEIQSDERDWNAFLYGAAIGFVVGGAAALLFAPKSGDELRGDIGEAIEELKDRAEKTVDELQVTAADIVSRSRQTIEETRENLVRSVEAGKEAYALKKEELTAQLDS
jgi:gas vesicle protein